HAGLLLVEGNETGVGADIGRDREPIIGIEPRTIESVQDFLPRPVVAVAQADALAFMQDRRCRHQVVASPLLDLDADTVLAAEGGGHRLGEAPWRSQPVAAEQGQHHPAARQLLAQAILPVLPSADVVLVVEERPARPLTPDALADRRGELVVPAAMADEDVGHKDRIFKRPFLRPGAISQDRQSCQFLFCLMKNPLLSRSAWPESSREASERFLMETLGRTQSERRRRLTLGAFVTALVS